MTWGGVAPQPTLGSKSHGVTWLPTHSLVNLRITLFQKCISTGAHVKYIFFFFFKADTTHTRLVSLITYGALTNWSGPSVGQRTAAVCKRGNAVTWCETTHGELGSKDATKTWCG